MTLSIASKSWRHASPTDPATVRRGGSVNWTSLDNSLEPVIVETEDASVASRPTINIARLKRALSASEASLRSGTTARTSSRSSSVAASSLGLLIVASRHSVKWKRQRTLAACDDSKSSGEAIDYRRSGPLATKSMPKTRRRVRIPSCQRSMNTSAIQGPPSFD
jgi:hypothetical protein